MNAFGKEPKPLTKHCSQPLAGDRALYVAIRCVDEQAAVVAA
jgi:hypothetical protein